MTQPYPLYPNILLEPLEPHPAVVNKRILGLLEPVIYELASTNPTWTFKEIPTQYTVVDDTRMVKGFTVHSGEASLGRISMSRNYSGRSSTSWVFDISNPRITRARERGSEITTGNPKTALKAVRKFFGPLTLGEKLDITQGVAKTAGYQALIDARERHNRANNSIQPAIAAFVHANWAQVLDSMQDSDRAVAESLTELREEQLSMETFLHQVSAKEHLTVLIEDDTYITHDGKTAQTYTSETLPTGIKVNIGMLKLLETGKVVRDVGIRISGKSFILYKGA